MENKIMKIMNIVKDQIIGQSLSESDQPPDFFSFFFTENMGTNKQTCP